MSDYYGYVSVNCNIEIKKNTWVSLCLSLIKLLKELGDDKINETVKYIIHNKTSSYNIKYIVLKTKIMVSSPCTL